LPGKLEYTCSKW